MFLYVHIVVTTQDIFYPSKRIFIFFEGSLWERFITNRTDRSSLKRHVNVSFCEIGITAFGMECKICDCKSQFQYALVAKSLILLTTK